jgi:hypothetical protein
MMPLVFIDEFAPIPQPVWDELAKRRKQAMTQKDEPPQEPDRQPDPEPAPQPEPEPMPPYDPIPGGVIPPGG